MMTRVSAFWFGLLGLALLLCYPVKANQAAPNGERIVGQIAYARGEVPVYAVKDTQFDPMFTCTRGQMLVIVSKSEEWARIALGNNGLPAPVGFCEPALLNYGRTVSLKDATQKSLAIPDGEVNPWLTLMVEGLQNGNSGILPPPNEEPAEEADLDPEVHITNQTAHTLNVFLSGSSTRRLTIEPNGGGSWRVLAGEYTVSASCSDPSIRPFTGPWTLKQGYNHTSTFYIRTTKVTVPVPRLRFRRRR